MKYVGVIQCIFVAVSVKDHTSFHPYIFMRIYNVLWKMKYVICIINIKLN